MIGPTVRDFKALVGEFDRTDRAKFLRDADRSWVYYRGVILMREAAFLRPLGNRLPEPALFDLAEALCGVLLNHRMTWEVPDKPDDVKWFCAHALAALWWLTFDDGSSLAAWTEAAESYWQTRLHRVQFEQATLW